MGSPFAHGDTVAFGFVSIAGRFRYIVKKTQMWQLHGAKVP